jgi:hypothetical protein
MEFQLYTSAAVCLHPSLLWKSRLKKASSLDAMLPDNEQPRKAFPYQ